MLLTCLPLGCGSDAGTGGEDGIDSYSYAVSGGLAGVDRRLTVTPDTVTVAENGAGPIAVEIDPAKLIAARDALQAAPLQEIATGPPAVDGPAIADDVRYTIEAGGATITASQARGTDPRLQPVIDALDQVLIDALDQVNPERG